MFCAVTFDHGSANLGYFARARTLQLPTPVPRVVLSPDLSQQIIQVAFRESNDGPVILAQKIEELLIDYCHPYYQRGCSKKRGREQNNIKNKINRHSFISMSNELLLLLSFYYYFLSLCHKGRFFFRVLWQRQTKQPMKKNIVRNHTLNLLFIPENTTSLKQSSPERHTELV